MSTCNHEWFEGRCVHCLATVDQADRIAALARDLAAANDESREIRNALAIADHEAMAPIVLRLKNDLAAAQQKNADLNTAFQVTFDRAMALDKDLAAAQAEIALNRNLLQEASVEAAEAKREVVRLEAERDDFKAAYLIVIQERKKAEAEAAAVREQYGRLRDAFHVNMLRAYPELSHADIDAAIDAARGGGNES